MHRNNRVLDIHFLKFSWRTDPVLPDNDETDKGGIGYRCDDGDDEANKGGIGYRCDDGDDEADKGGIGYMCDDSDD